MPKLIILGTSNAIPSEGHENTHMLLAGNHKKILIDCVSNPTVRMDRVGIKPDDLTDLILTHFHPDHVSGVPSLLMSMWLLGRSRPLNVYGLAHTLDRVEKLMQFYDWESWPNFFEVNFVRLPEINLYPVFKDHEFRVFSTPVQHMVPTIGLRIEFVNGEKVLAYSCDTEPSPQVVELAAGADVLIHEASGATFGHSSAAQAGEIARKAEVGALYLIHYPTRNGDAQSLVEQAQATFGGKTFLARDFMELEF